MNWSTIKPFVAIDGEGITVGRNHYYNLITARCAAMDETIIQAAKGTRLTTWEIFDFLRKRLSPFRHEKAIFIMFSFDYDITKWLEDLTHDQLSELYLTTKVHVVSPEGINYTLTYFRRKFFRLDFIYKKDGILHPTSIVLYDVFSFFGCSFVKALEQWGFEVPDFLREMKGERGNFKNIDQQTIINYNALECELLCRLMNKVRDALDAEGIPLTKWHGSGAVAQKLLEVQSAQTQIQIPQIINNSDLHDALMGSYFGGRFELFRKGIINHTFQYDINSAYPYAMATLPDLSGCTVEYSTNYTHDKYSIWFVRYNVLDHGTKRKQFKYAGANTNLAGPFPYRTKSGTIVYPYFNSSGVWIHQCELEVALRIYGAGNFTILYGWILKPRDVSKSAFQFIPDLATRRLFLKERGDQRNIVLKLALNSLYGKTAQGQKQVGIIPPFQNYYIAGYITAYTRSTLLAESYSCGRFGSGIIQFATDGIFSMVRNSHIQHSSNAFGDWEFTNIPVPMVYIQGGIYYSEAQAKTQKRRTRGFNANALDAKEVFHAWRQFYYSHGQSPQYVTASDTRFFGLGTTIATNNWNRFGRFIKTERQLSFFTPSKQFANAGDELLTGSLEWDYMAPRIRGIERKEIISNKEYTLMVPDPELIEGISKPYAPVNLKEQSNIPEHILQMIIASIQSGEQPDYYDEENLELEI